MKKYGRAKNPPTIEMPASNVRPRSSGSDDHTTPILIVGGVGVMGAIAFFAWLLNRNQNTPPLPFVAPTVAGTGRTIQGPGNFTPTDLTAGLTTPEWQNAPQSRSHGWMDMDYGSSSDYSQSSPAPTGVTKTPGVTGNTPRTNPVRTNPVMNPTSATPAPSSTTERIVLAGGFDAGVSAAKATMIKNAVIGLIGTVPGSVYDGSTSERAKTILMGLTSSENRAMNLLARLHLSAGQYLLFMTGSISGNNLVVIVTAFTPTGGEVGAANFTLPLSMNAPPSAATLSQVKELIETIAG